MSGGRTAGTMSGGRAIARALCLLGALPLACAEVITDVGGIPDPHAIETLATSQDGAFALAEDGTFLYWSDIFRDGGSVWSWPLAGGEPHEVARDMGAVDAIEPHQSRLLVAQYDRHAIASLALPEGTVTDVVTGIGAIQDLAVRGDFVYWAANGQADWPQRGLYRVPLSGGVPEPLATDVSCPTLALSADSVFAHDWTSQSLYRWALVDGSRQRMASVSGRPWGIAESGGSVWWAEYEAGRVMTSSGGSGDAVIVADHQDGVHSVSVVGQTIYWTSYLAGTVSRKTGALPVEIVASGLAGPKNLRVVKDRVYVTNYQGSVVRFAR